MPLLQDVVGLVYCAKKESKRWKVADEKEEEEEEEQGREERVREFIHETGDGILERRRRGT